MLCYQGLGAGLGVGEFPYALYVAWVGWGEGVQGDVDRAEEVGWDAVEEVCDVAKTGGVGCGVVTTTWPFLVAGA